MMTTAEAVVAAALGRSSWETATGLMTVHAREYRAAAASRWCEPLEPKVAFFPRARHVLALFEQPARPADEEMHREGVISNNVQPESCGTSSPKLGCAI